MFWCRVTKTILEVIRMNEWEDEIDWLTGEYTYKRDRLRRELRRLESYQDEYY